MAPRTGRSACDRPSIAHAAELDRTRSRVGLHRARAELDRMRSRVSSSRTLPNSMSDQGCFAHAANSIDREHEWVFFAHAAELDERSRLLRARVQIRSNAIPSGSCSRTPPNSIGRDPEWGLFARRRSRSDAITSGLVRARRQIRSDAITASSRTRPNSIERDPEWGLFVHASRSTRCDLSSRSEKRSQLGVVASWR